MMPSLYKVVALLAMEDGSGVTKLRQFNRSILLRVAISVVNFRQAIRAGTPHELYRREAWSPFLKLEPDM